MVRLCWVSNDRVMRNWIVYGTVPSPFHRIYLQCDPCVTFLPRVLYSQFCVSPLVRAQPPPPPPPKVVTSYTPNVPAPRVLSSRYAEERDRQRKLQEEEERKKVSPVFPLPASLSLCPNKRASAYWFFLWVDDDAHWALPVF